MGEFEWVLLVMLTITIGLTLYMTHQYSVMKGKCDDLQSSYSYMEQHKSEFERLERMKLDEVVNQFNTNLSVGQTFLSPTVGDYVPKFMNTKQRIVSIDIPEGKFVSVNVDNESEEWECEFEQTKYFIWDNKTIKHKFI